MKKRMLSLLVALCMVVSLTATVLADTDRSVATGETAISTSETAEPEPTAIPEPTTMPEDALIDVQSVERGRQLSVSGSSGVTLTLSGENVDYIDHATAIEDVATRNMLHKSMDDIVDYPFQWQRLFSYFTAFKLDVINGSKTNLTNLTLEIRLPKALAGNAAYALEEIKTNDQYPLEEIVSNIHLVTIDRSSGTAHVVKNTTAREDNGDIILTATLSAENTTYYSSESDYNLDKKEGTNKRASSWTVNTDCSFAVTWEEDNFVNVTLPNNSNSNNDPRLKSYQGHSYAGYTDSYTVRFHAWNYTLTKHINPYADRVKASGPITIYRHFDTEESKIPEGVKKNGVTETYGRNNIVRCDDTNLNMHVNGYTITGARMIRANGSIQPVYALRWTDLSMDNGYGEFTGTTVRDRYHGYRTADYVQDIMYAINNLPDTAQQVWKDREYKLGNAPLGIHVYYKREQESTNELKIVDTIKTDGNLNAVYSPKEGKAGDYTYVWYRKAADGTAYERVIGETGKTLNVVYNNGGHATFYVEVYQKGNSKCLAVSDTYQVQYNNVLVNGDFERPILYPALQNKVFYNNYSGSFQVEQNAYADFGWKTTGLGKFQSDFHKEDAKIGAAGCDIELIRASGTNDVSTNKPLSNYGVQDGYDGHQFAELNCEATGTLYQDILTIPNTPMYWSVSHRSRTKGLKTKYNNNGLEDGHQPNARDAMAVIIMKAADADEYMTDPNATGVAAAQYMQNQIWAIYEEARQQVNQVLASGEQLPTADKFGADLLRKDPQPAIYGKIGKVPEGQKAPGIEVTVTKNGKSYKATIWIVVSDANWHRLNNFEYTPAGDEYLSRFMLAAIGSYDDWMTTGNLLDGIAYSQFYEPEQTGEATLIIEKKVEGVPEDTVIPKESYQFRFAKNTQNDRGNSSLPTQGAPIGATSLWSKRVQVVPGTPVYVSEASPVESISSNTYNYTYKETSYVVVKAQNGTEIVRAEGLGWIAEKGDIRIESNDAVKVTFTNTYKRDSGNLTIEKKVEGEGAPEEEFTFHLTLTKEAELLESWTKPLTYKDTNNVDWTLNCEEGKDYYEFTLKANEKYTFAIPSGYKATIAEEPGKKGCYLVSYAGYTETTLGGSDQQLAPVQGDTFTTDPVNMDDNINVIVTNTFYIPNPTGVNESAVPFVVMIAIAVPVLFAMTRRKRG